MPQIKCKECKTESTIVYYEKGKNDDIYQIIKCIHKGCGIISKKKITEFPKEIEQSKDEKIMEINIQKLKENFKKRMNEKNKDKLIILNKEKEKIVKQIIEEYIT